MEEAWVTRFGAEDSVHLQDFPETPKGWADDALVTKWNRLRNLRRVVTGALEIARRDKVIGASLEASPTLYVESAEDMALFAGLDLAEIAITSNARLVQATAPPDSFRLSDVPGAGVVFAHAEGEKCARCWMVLPEVGAVSAHPDLCRRCSEAVA
jgi:isoleucyl-tRNA synthetase